MPPSSSLLIIKVLLLLTRTCMIFIIICIRGRCHGSCVYTGTTGMRMMSLNKPTTNNRSTSLCVYTYVYVCIYIYIYICIHTHKYIHTYTYYTCIMTCFCCLLLAYLKTSFTSLLFLYTHRNRDSDHGYKLR